MLGGTDEDCFMGVFTTVAISSIDVSARPQLGRDAHKEIDHLQLGALSPRISLASATPAASASPLRGARERSNPTRR